MNFKKPKEALLEEARWEAENLIRGVLSNHFGSGLRLDSYSVASVFAQAISQGIEAGLRVIVENTYTDLEFEEDMTLRDKQN